MVQLNCHLGLVHTTRVRGLCSWVLVHTACEHGTSSRPVNTGSMYGPSTCVHWPCGQKASHNNAFCPTALSANIARWHRCMVDKAFSVLCRRSWVP